MRDEPEVVRELALDESAKTTRRTRTITPESRRTPYFELHVLTSVSTMRLPSREVNIPSATNWHLGGTARAAQGTPPLHARREAS